MNENRPGLAAAVKREYATKVVLSLVFLFAVVFFAILTGPAHLLQSIQSWGVLDFVLLSLSTYRLGHLVAYDRVMEPFRHAFARTVPDITGAGESVEPMGSGIRCAIGQLISCPICAGTWIAALLVFALVLLPEGTRLFLWMTAAIGLAEVFNSFTEALCWSGQLSRNQAGEINRARPVQDEAREQKGGNPR